MKNEHGHVTNSYFSQRLHTNARRIIASFIVKTRQELPSAATLDDANLENGLEHFIHILAKILMTEQTEQWAGLYNDNVINSRVHGKTRAEIPHYTLDQVISEYRILRTDILAVLGEERPIPQEQLDKIMYSIDNGITQAATEFAVVRGFADARLSEEGTKRDQFVATLSHDMRNPLSIARACAEMIQRKPDNVELTQKYTYKIIESIDRANNMIQDLLDSNRIRAGVKLTVSKNVFDVSSLLKEVTEDFSQVYGDRFQMDCPDELSICADINGVRRAIENLLTNALKYGDPQTTITTSVREENNHVQINVLNFGNPILPQDQTSLFNYLHRTSSGIETGKQGWGIGLTLVKGIAEAHDGQVVVRSSKDEGTTFSLVLPKR